MEDSVQDALDAARSIEIKMNRKYVVQPFWFPDELSVEHIQEDGYEKRTLPGIALPMNQSSAYNPNVSTNLVQIEWNVIIPETGRNQGVAKRPGKNPLFLNLVHQEPSLLPVNSGSSANSHPVAAGHAGGVPTNIATMAAPGGDNVSVLGGIASTATGLRRSRRITGRRSGTVSVIQEDEDGDTNMI